jgi:hypothetical protein
MFFSGGSALIEIRRCAAASKTSSRLDNKPGLVSSAPVWDADHLIGKGNSVRFAYLEGRPNPKLRPQL